MRCSYTNFQIEHRFGVPQVKKSDSEKLFLTGCYGSVGIALRAITDRVAADGGYTPATLSIISRIGGLIGKPLTITRKADPEKKKDVELVFDSREMSAILELCAPPASDLEINGGKLTRADYIKKDPTWKPEYNKYGQTVQEVAEQKASVKAKREKARGDRSYVDADHARYFHIGLPAPGVEKKDLITRVTAADLAKTSLLTHKTVYINESSSQGVRIAVCGGPCHNKLATKKFWGSDWANHPMLKGDVVIICTGGAPLDIAEYLPPDSDWLSKLESTCETVQGKPITPTPVPTTSVSVSNTKKRKNGNE